MFVKVYNVNNNEIDNIWYLYNLLGAVAVDVPNNFQILIDKTVQITQQMRHRNAVKIVIQIAKAPNAVSNSEKHVILKLYPG